MGDPFFSVVVTTYNREQIVRRCVDSCLRQTFEDFEVVVVDDASSDGTAAAIEAYADPRVRLVAHERNRGINPARHTGAEAARGEWVVVVDSDDELTPNALERLHEVIAERHGDIRVIRSRLIRDNGRITPSFVPDGPYDYEGRIRWAEAEGGHDAGRCLHRSVFERSPYIEERRGAMETLFELNLAKNELSLCIADVLGIVHEDAPNSWLRSFSSKDLMMRLRREAPDMLWMAETTIALHGDALRRWGPRQIANMERVAALQAFLLGRRRLGLSHALVSLRQRPWVLTSWATVTLGLLGPGAVARGSLALRRLQALRA